MDGFGDRLLSWYHENKRDLPWRSTKDPYKIWLSEIILQQTRVDQGLDYYMKFVETFPDVYALASAPQTVIFKMWQGLGYYNRAANMILTAKTIVETYNGKFPKKRDELLKLKGVGPYTSAAIASFANNEPVVVVDGNVLRVLSRLFGISTAIDSSQGKKEIEELALKMMGNLPSDEFNQAIMEFGALQCTPKKPNCNDCIFANNCVAFLENEVATLPVKKKSKSVKNRYFYYYFIESTEKATTGFFIKKRESKDIWQNLYDFPLYESSKKIEPLEVAEKQYPYSGNENADFRIKSISEEYIHLLSHQKIHAWFIHIVVDKKIFLGDDYSLLLVEKEKLTNYPVPKLIDRYLQDKNMLK